MTLKQAPPLPAVSQPLNKSSKLLSAMLLMPTFVLGAILGGCDRLPQLSAKPRQPVNKELNKLISGGLGIIEPKGNLRTISPASGLRPNISVERLYVDEGDLVSAGQTLALLNGYETTRTRLLGFEAQRKQVSRLYELSRYELDRYSNLVSQGASTDELKRSKQLEMEKTKLDLAQLDADIANTKSDLRDLMVLAPIAGSIVKLNVREGERIVPSDGLLVISPSGNIQVSAEVYENNIRNISKGNRAFITSQHNAFPGKVVGEVTRINPLVEATTIRPTDPMRIADARIVKVIISVPSGEDKVLRQFIGSTVNVSISPNN